MSGSPDDDRAVLGDALQERGDPQGELIALQLALEALSPDALPARRTVLERRIAAHLDRHHDALYGALAPKVTQLSRPDLREPALAVKRWRAGFADTAWLQATRGLELPAAVAALRALPIARHLRRLELDAGDQVAAVAELIRDPFPGLRELVIVTTSRSPLPTVVLQDLAPVAPLLGTLERFELGAPIAYTPFSSPTLRALSLSTHSEAFVSATVVMAAELPKLEDLQLIGFRFDCKLLDRYPRLVRLRLNGWFAPGWVEYLLRSPVFGQLRSVELGHTLTADDLALFVRHASQLASLEQLDLTSNWFGFEAVDAARAQLPAWVRLR